VYLWVLVHRKDVPGWWPQGGKSINVADDGAWSVRVTYGGPNDVGRQFEIASVVVSRPVHAQWLQWVQSVRETGLYPPVQLPRYGGLIAERYRTVNRR
jgi:hypothetical protein